MKGIHDDVLQLSVPQINVLDIEGVPSPDDAWTVPLDFFGGGLTGELPAADFCGDMFARTAEPCGGGVDFSSDAATTQFDELAEMVGSVVGYTGMATPQFPADVHSPSMAELSLPFTDLGLASRTSSPAQLDNGYMDPLSPSSSTWPYGFPDALSPSSSSIDYTSILNSPVQNSPQTPFMGNYDPPFVDFNSTNGDPYPVPCVGTPSGILPPSMASYNVSRSPTPLFHPSPSPAPQGHLARSLSPAPAQSYSPQSTSFMPQSPWPASPFLPPFTPLPSPIQSSSPMIPSQVPSMSHFNKHTSDPPMQMTPLQGDPYSGLGGGYMDWCAGGALADNELDELIASAIAVGFDVRGLS